jgi:hypothetical protein
LEWIKSSWKGVNGSKKSIVMSIEKFLKDLKEQSRRNGTLLEFSDENGDMEIMKIRENGIQIVIENSQNPGVTAKVYMELSEEQKKEMLNFLLFEKQIN